MSMDLKDIKDVEKQLMEQHDMLEGFIKEANEKTKVMGDAGATTQAAIDKIAEKCIALADRLAEFEQKGVGDGGGAAESFGEQFIKTDQWKAVQEGRNGIARLEMKTAIINATGSDQPLVQADRLGGIQATPNRNLRVRDMIPAGPTTSNLVEFARENTFTNSAGAQVGESPEVFENVTKAESGITFTLVQEPIRTIAHWIPASKQVLSDSGMLKSYIDGRMIYGLKLKEETQLLLGDNANGELNGIYTQATAYTVQSPELTNELDIIREAIKQAQVSEYMPNAIILNPQDWYDIDVKKVGSSDDRYVVGNPREFSAPNLWGLPVVITNSITSGTFLLGSFDIGAHIWDREQSSIEVSRDDGTNFVKNMVTILAEERMCVTVFRTEAFIKGSL